MITKLFAKIKKINLRQFNNILSIGVVLIGAYLFILPFLPTIQLWIDQWFDDTNGVRYDGQLANINNVSSDNLDNIPSENTLVIPEIQVDEQIFEGDSLGVINDGGVWHRPGTSTPDKGGNTVFVGHRFSYSDPSTFYHLDKIKIGQKFAVFWQGTEYVYEVFDTGVVPATALGVEDPTAESIITLYTCTPIWTAKDRLVIRAMLISAPNEQRDIAS